ncbi:MAG TPA: phosphorybosylanthranilate isomerase, partial [candidate division WOR-3 bacterium]|nr:phosphorybosylanthranilate isomerase [candidate division WOR-3 bacterium]
KHAISLGLSPREEAKNALSRGGADALIVTGEATGEETDPGLLTLIKDISGDSPVLVGSGITPDNIARYREADGFIVGSYIKVEGKAGNPVNIERAKRLRSAWETL